MKRMRVGLATALLLMAGAALWLWHDRDGSAPGKSSASTPTPPNPVPTPRFEPRSDWAPALFQATPSQIGDPGPYVEGSGVYERPFDASDPEMQALMSRVYARGGCARPGKPCQPAMDLFAEGSDRLATYLIAQFERSLAGGYPNRLTYLSYIAYTRSETGFDYILERVRRGSDLPLQDYRYAARALSYTAHDRAIDEAFRLLDTESDPGVLNSVFNTFVRVSRTRQELRPDVLSRLLVLEQKPSTYPKANESLRLLAESFEIPERPTPDWLSPDQPDAEERIVP